MNRFEYIQRGRELAKRGEALPHAKLTEQTVIAAREEYARAQFALVYIRAHYSIAGLARKYGVSRNAMHRALTRENWGHI